MPRFLHFPPKKLVSQPLKSGEAAASPVPPPLQIIFFQKNLANFEGFFLAGTFYEAHKLLISSTNSVSSTYIHIYKMR